MAKKSLIQTPNGETTVLLHTCCAPCSSAIIEALMKNGITPVIYYCNPNIYPREEYEIRKNECTRYAESLGLEIVDADYDHENWLEAMRGSEDEPERGGRCLKCFKFRLLRTAEYAAQRGIRLITTTLASSRWKSLEQIDEAGRWACEEVGRRSQIKFGMTYVEPGMTCVEPGMTNGVGGSVMEGGSGKEKGISAKAALSVFRLPELPEGQGRPEGPEGQEVVWWGQNWRKGGLQERRLQIIKEYDFYNQLYCGCEFSMRKGI